MLGMFSILCNPWLLYCRYAVTKVRAKWSDDVGVTCTIITQTSSNISLGVPLRNQHHSRNQSMSHRRIALSNTVHLTTEYIVQSPALVLVLPDNGRRGNVSLYRCIVVETLNEATAPPEARTD